MSKWQPIETLPVDENGAFLVCDTRLANLYDYEQSVANVWVMDDPTNLAVCDLSEEGNIQKYHGTATHWMPLPEPPEDA